MTLISVAMGTCEGARFLDEQLESIAAQARRPDELVVTDDASSDGTIAVLEAFAARAPFPVHITRNASRLGVAANFALAIGRCTGDLVATADQDDLWHRDRLARAEPLFADPKVSLSFSDADLVDAAGRPLGRSLWESVGFAPAAVRQLAAGDALAVLLGRLVVTGATMTVRRAFAAKVLPAASGWLHDAWLGFFAGASAGIAPIPERLISYRQHGANQIGAPDEAFGTLAKRAFTGDRRARVAAQLAQWTALRERASDFDDAILPSAARARLDERIAHLQVRAALGRGPLERAGAVLRELRTGRYAGNGNGRWSAVQDIVG